MSNIIPFNFHNSDIRVVQDENGEPWFVLADICKVLELSNPTMVADRLDDDEKCNPKSDLGLRKDQILINESGLYSVVLRSDKPEAKPFKKWLTSEVLPSIRKKGFYSKYQEPQEIKPTIDANKLFKSNLSIAKSIFKGNQAILSANQATRKMTHIDVLDNLGATALLSETKDALLTATDIGKQIGLSGIKTNLLIEEKGLVISFRDHKNKKQYELTEKGEKFGVALDTTKKHGDGTPVTQIKWYSRIIEILKDKAA